jgi:hypothetical protein
MSHHGNPDPFADDRMHNAMRQIFGEHPNGKLNADDAGALALEIGVERGAVVIKFPKAVAWIGFTPDQAMDIAGALIKHARAAGATTPLTLRVG